MRIAIAGATGLIGSQLTALAREAGHEVVEIARETGFDLLSPDSGLEQALAGVDTVVDVTACPLDQAATFFPTVARNIGTAATAAGVRRSVVLSIVGVDRSPDYDYYVAKLAQEQAYRETAPGVVEGDVDLAGPKQENLVDQVRRLVERSGQDVRVEPVAAPESLTNGAMLPGTGALLRGPSFDDWLAAQA
jgi:hypothetical protein